MVNYDRLASELLRALRGGRSQSALARRLGYRANVAHTWERGTRFPPAQVLFHLAVANRISLEAIVRFPRLPAAVPIGAAWQPAMTAAWLRALTGDTPVVDLARAVGVDRSTVARWLRGTTEPRIPELLALIDRTTHRLVDFVTLFAKPDALPALRDLARDLAAQRRLAYELPWSHAVLRALELHEYRRLPAHVPGVIARAIGIDLETERKLLAELRQAHVIRRQRGKWVLARVLTVDTASQPERNRQLKEHWAEVALGRLRRSKGPSEAFHSYNLFGVSRADFARIRELHVEYFERVRRIVAESELAERVVLLVQELVPLDEPPPPASPRR
jgi:transcriptional regulator with XRE-family HTH domain